MAQGFSFTTRKLGFTASVVEETRLWNHLLELRKDSSSDSCDVNRGKAFLREDVECFVGRVGQKTNESTGNGNSSRHSFLSFLLPEQWDLAAILHRRRW